MATTQANEYVSVSELARRLKTARSTLYRNIQRGSLRAIRVGEDGPIRVPVDALGDFLIDVHPPERAPSGGK